MGSNRAPLLQHIRSRFRRVELSPSGRLRPWPSLRLRDRIDGHYDVVAGVPWMIYRDPDGLVLRVGDRAFPLDDATALAWSGAGALRRLEVRRDGAVVASLACPAPRTPLLDATLRATPFAEAEDFDLPRLVHDVAADPGRRARAYR